MLLEEFRTSPGTIVEFKLARANSEAGADLPWIHDRARVSQLVEALERGERRPGVAPGADAEWRLMLRLSSGARKWVDVPFISRDTNGLVRFASEPYGTIVPGKELRTVFADTYGWDRLEAIRLAEVALMKTRR